VICSAFQPGCCLSRCSWRHLGPPLQVRSSGQAGGQPPGAVAAGRPVPTGRGEGEFRPEAGAGSAGRWIVADGRGVVAGWPGFGRSGGADAVFGFGPGAAVTDGVSLLVGDGDAVRGPGIAGGSISQVTDQGRVDGPDTGELAGPVGQAQHRFQGRGQVDAAAEPGRDHARYRRHQGPVRFRCARPATARTVITRTAVARTAVGGCGGFGLGEERGVAAEDDVQVGAGPELVHVAVQARLLQLLGPPRNALVGGQDVGGRQFPAGQAGVPGVLGPAFHPGVFRAVLAPLGCLVRGDLDDRALDRGPQPARGQPPGPVQDQRLSGAGLFGGEVGDPVGDDLDLGLTQDPGPERRPGAGQLDGQGDGQVQHGVRGPPGISQRPRQLRGGELLPAPGPVQDRLAADPGQLIIRGPGEPVIVPGRVLGEPEQRGTAGSGIQQVTGRERAGRAGRVIRRPPRRAGLPGTPPAARGWAAAGGWAGIRGWVGTSSGSSPGSSPSSGSIESSHAIHSSRVSQSSAAAPGSPVSRAGSSSRSGSGDTGSAGMGRRPFREDSSVSNIIANLYAHCNAYRLMGTIFELNDWSYQCGSGG